MKAIKILQPVMLAGKMFLKGRVIQINDSVASDLITRGIAELAPEPAAKGKPKTEEPPEV